MERLTVRTENGAALAMDGDYRDEEEARKALMAKYREAMERLADYEDVIDDFGGERRRLFPDEVDAQKERVVRAAMGLRNIEELLIKLGRRALAAQAVRALDVLKALLSRKDADDLEIQLSFDLPGTLMKCNARTLQAAFDQMDDSEKLDVVWNIGHFVTLNGVSKDALHHMFKWLVDKTISSHVTFSVSAETDMRKKLTVLNGGLDHDRE